MDRAALLARVDNDQGLLRELVGIFLEDCPGWLEQIQFSVRRSDACNLKLFAHLLGGTASNFGASVVTAAARRLERMGDSGNLGGAEEACVALLVAMDELQPALIELTHCPLV